MTDTPRITRRALLGALSLPALAACTTPLPMVSPPPGAVLDADAAALVRESAEAHGLAAFRALHDVNVAYDGQWRPLVGAIQPEIVDAGFRGRSEERLLVGAGVYAQRYTGEKGTKQVVRKRGRVAAGSGDLGSVSVWLNGERNADPAVDRAAALVADGYVLFLLGPMAVVDRGLPMARAGTVVVDGHACDVVDVWLAPGLGLVGADRVSLCIDQADRTMRRVRFTLEGFPGTKGAVAEVDSFEHARRFGVLWPMRSYERVVHPLYLPAHDWRVTGLDVNRGYAESDLAGPSFTGRALASAGPSA